MNIVTLNETNIADEHICCAFSDKKCRDGYEAKKGWLREQFADGYTFKKGDVRGKVFIEYVAAEQAWAPLDAPGYTLINCFWVSGKYKGQGHGKMLFNECLNDSQGKNGIAVITGTKKLPFMPDKKFFQRQGFERCDSAEPYFELWHLPLKSGMPAPRFKECARQASCESESDVTVFYTNACPFTEYYVNTELVAVTAKRGLSLDIRKLETRQQAQNHSVPFTLYSVFYHGKFVTQHILNEKNFDKFVPGTA